ncbi:hypothetical protein JOF53_007028 [Crossiella equi]|uniref:DUF4262 domain-containing protein n=1 Tax=Crossiella equi TaxID=130796 RepID=A0ABS5ANL3_9PSEU|nr:DUF4262 domain-containing protein [Crossiella equi]MBP2478156.1 hypothetical protein [Crossiella equi]
MGERGIAEQERRGLLKRVAEEDFAAVAVAAERDPVTGLAVPGCHYTVGLWALRRTPELIVVGAPDRHAKDLLRRYTERAAAGEEFLPGVLYDGYVEGYRVTFERVAPGQLRGWFGQAGALYPDWDFPALQLLWPKHDHTWPWDRLCWRFHTHQPVLTASGAPESWLPGVNGP